MAHFSRRELLAALAGLPLLASAARGQGSPPVDVRALQSKNVLLIMADDAGREVFDFTGGTYHPTPHLNALAARSINFDTCYATPLCTTSRIALLTGLLPFESGWPNNPRQTDRCRVLAPELKTLGNTFQDAGYRTALAGKWHLSHHDVDPERITTAGFDEWLIWAWRLAEDGNNFNRYWEPATVQRGGTIEFQQDVYGPDAFAGFLMNFMAQAAEDDAPFFAYYPMVLTHDPYCTPPTEAPDFSSLMDETHHQEVQENTVCAENMDDDPNEFPQLIRYTDQLVGQVLDFLDRTGLREDTIIIFTTDNGTKYDINSSYKGHQISGGKGTFFDLGVNVPLLIDVPGMGHGQVSAPVDFTDLHDLVAALAGDSDAARTWPDADGARRYAMSGLDGNWAITDGRWKLISFTGAGYKNLMRRNRRRRHKFVVSPSRISLYDLASDPLERHPINPLTAMANPATREPWQRLQSEATRRISAGNALPLAAHYPRGRDRCWE